MRLPQNPPLFNHDIFLCHLSLFFFSGDVFGSKDYFYGLGVFFDTYSNHNGEHQVSELCSVII